MSTVPINGASPFPSPSPQASSSSLSSSPLSNLSTPSPQGVCTPDNPQGLPSSTPTLSNPSPTGESVQNQPSDSNCATCTASKSTTQADSTNASTVNYEQVNAGPVNLTHFSNSDGSLNMYAPGVAPTSTDVGVTAGTCLVVPNAGQTQADVVGGWSVGGNASTGMGAEVGTSTNLSGSMYCAGISGGTPGASPTASYAMTPSDWGNALVSPDPDGMLRSLN